MDAIVMPRNTSSESSRSPGACELGRAPERASLTGAACEVRGGTTAVAVVAGASITGVPVKSAIKLSLSLSLALSLLKGEGEGEGEGECGTNSQGMKPWCDPSGSTC